MKKGKATGRREGERRKGGVFMGTDASIINTIILFLFGGGAVAIFNKIWASSEATIKAERERNAAIVPALENITETLSDMRDSLKRMEGHDEELERIGNQLEGVNLNLSQLANSIRGDAGGPEREGG